MVNVLVVIHPGKIIIDGNYEMVMGMFDYVICYLMYK